MLRFLTMLVMVLASTLSGGPATAFDASAASPVVASAVLASEAPGRTRLAIEFSARPVFSVRSLEAPIPLAVIDLDGVRFDLPAGAGERPSGLITRFRYGEVAPGRARLVVDLSGPFLVQRAFWLPPLAGQKGRLVLDFVATRGAQFAAAVAQSRVGSPSGNGDALADPVPKGDRPVVVIDPGHGGIDPGTIGANGTLEKDVTLAFAKALRAELERRGLVDVRLTRSDDRYLTLSERVRIAHAYGAGLFLSIHADSAPEQYVRGATVYTLSARASDSEAAAMAIRENLADSLGGATADAPSDTVADILTDLARRETKTFTSRFAHLLVRDLSAHIRMVETHPHRSAAFKVLTPGDIPSALLELGYLSNPDDESLLLDPGWRQKAVASIADATDAFFGLGGGRADRARSKLAGSVARR